MSKVIKTRVLLDTREEQDIFRDIELLETQSFLEFHNAIQTAFGFDNSQMAAFYTSDEEWDRGKEISLMDMGLSNPENPEDAILLMENTTMESILADGTNKFIYVFDFFLMWTFLIEVVTTDGNVRQDVEYPVMTLSYGDAPDQYSKEPDTDFSNPFNMDDEDPEVDPDDDEGYY